MGQYHVVRRPPEHWVRRLLDVQGEAWLRSRRIAAGSLCAWAGRLDVCLPGAVRATVVIHGWRCDGGLVGRRLMWNRFGSRSADQAWSEW